MVLVGDDVPGTPRAWAEIDLDAFAANVDAVRRRAPNGRVLAVLKANAYGHGALPLAPLALAAGAEMLGVGDSTEALELRKAGIDGPIVVLGALVPSEIPQVVASGITLVLHSQGRIQALEAEAARQGRRVVVHLKVDTGMGRLGMLPERLLEAARAVRRSEHLVLDGIMSHVGGSSANGNLAQRAVFEACLAKLFSEGIRPTNIHFRSTAGIWDPCLAVDGETLVRAGAALYGFAPHASPEAMDAAFSGGRPVLSLRTQIVFIKDVSEGVPVGYGGAFVTARPTRLAVAPMGYHDGLPRALARYGCGLVGGRRAPFAGAISMDYSTFDVTDVEGAQVGDRVTLIGVDGAETLRVEELAAWAGTIPYEIVSRLGARVVRTAARVRVTSA